MLKFGRHEKVFVIKARHVPTNIAPACTMDDDTQQSKILKDVFHKNFHARKIKAFFFARKMYAKSCNNYKIIQNVYKII